ncbi:MAG TPA: type II toxin-antitoxin system HipA family toxin YjjJ [Desulfobacteraceae bacterium]|nr:type II toxin-antitoxin system HipA family toxin YjjJ [Desulfobacteraceae bacterium]
MVISIRKYLSRGPSTSKEIQAATGLSQSSVARHIKREGDRIIPLQKGRSVKYAATCNAFGGGDKLPIGIINTQGNFDLLAYLRPLVHGGFLVAPVKETSPLLLGEGNDGLYDGLPYFLYDVRPQGFLGRQIAQWLATATGAFPSNPKRWTTEHVGRYLIANGEDLPGNIVFGEQALLRVKGHPTPLSEEKYPVLADRVMNVPPGSSAGGEQPKFTTYNGKLSSHVIVKFSPKGNNPVADRWRDILITEHHAANMLNKHIFPATTSRLLEMDNRYFLETKRMDRHQKAGRSSMISLEAIDAEYAGLGDNWPQVMSVLLDNDLVDSEDVLFTESLWLFGQLIYNTDMHLGNLSLAIENDKFRLLPVYDMCSMGFAPKSGGEVPPYEMPTHRSFRSIHSLKTLLDEEWINTVKAAACDFWEEVANDERTSDEFKKFLEQGNPLTSCLGDESPFNGLQH